MIVGTDRSISFGGVFFIFVCPFFFLFSFVFLLISFWLLGFLAFWLLGFWLLGFLASWLLGFLASWLASWLFGFLASQLLPFASSAFLFGRWHFGFYGFSLVYAAFGGFSFLHPLLSQFLSGLFGCCTLSLVFGCGFPHHQHHQFRPI